MATVIVPAALQEPDSLLRPGTLRCSCLCSLFARLFSKDILLSSGTTEYGKVTHYFPVTCNTMAMPAEYEAVSLPTTNAREYQ